MPTKGLFSHPPVGVWNGVFAALSQRRNPRQTIQCGAKCDAVAGVSRGGAVQCMRLLLPSSGLGEGFPLQRH